ncbi:hypothetical protein GCM10027427_12470 [Pseudoclavibacter terrae]
MDIETKNQRMPRRRVLQASAWSVPVVALTVASPALAASRCTQGAIDWSSYPVGTQITTVPVAGASPATTATFSVAYSAQATPSTNSGQTRSGPQGGLANFYLVELLRPKPNDAVTIRIQFSRPVTNLSFQLLDIDATANAYRDQVRVLTPGFSFVLAPQVIGLGTDVDPFRQRNPIGPIANTSSDGNVRLSWPSPISQVEFRYLQPNEASNAGNMLIGLSNVTATVCP